MAEFVKVAQLSNLPVGKLMYVDIEGEEICLINSEGKIYAIQEHCTHEEGPLHEGTLRGNEIICPWHESRFDFRTGKRDPETDWAKADLRTYEVKVEGNDILVKV